jgi:DNA primase
MEASGLVLKRQDAPGYFDRFRGRLMFPIHSESGKIIAFAGRALAAGDEPKYLNSAETAIYRKNQVLYNLHRAREAVRKSGFGILVEGYMDVIGLHAAGVREAVASCGTALTAGQVRTLKRYSENLVVNFDPDAAGSNAAERSIQLLLEEGMRVRVLELQGGQDPDEFVKAHGAGAYREALERAPSYFHWLADRASGRCDMRSAQGRGQALQFLMPAIQRVGDKLDRAAIANDMAGYLGVEPGLVLDHFKKSAAERSEPGLRKTAEPVRAVEKILLNSLLLGEDLRPKIIPRLRQMPAVERFAAAEVFRTMFALYDREPGFRFPDLEARLEESGRSILAEAALADELSEADYSLEQAEACLEKLDAEDREARRRELRQRVKEAERAGDFGLVRRYTQELIGLERRN